MPAEEAHATAPGGALHDTTVYRYGLLEPLNWDEHAREQLALQNRLWNALVQIEHHSSAQYRLLMSQHPQLAPLQAQVNELRERRKELSGLRRQQRKSTRSRAPDPQLDEQISRIGAAMKPLTGQLKALRTRARAELAAPLAALEARRAELTEQARKQSGLWWPNGNAVMHAYTRARSRALKQGAELQFHRFTGEGRFTVQLVGGRSIEELTAGGCSQARLELIPQPAFYRRPSGELARHKGRPLPRLSIAISNSGGGRQPRLLTFPIVYDRPLPAGARIQGLTVTRRRAGLLFEHHVIFHLWLPAQPFPVHPAPQRCCAINFGFRQRPCRLRPWKLAPRLEQRFASMGEAGAVLREAAQLAQGHALRVAYIHDGEASWELCLPPSLLWHLSFVEALRGLREQRLNALLAQLRERWPARPPEPQPLPPGAQPPWAPLDALLRAPKVPAARLACLIRRWAAQPYGHYWPQMLQPLQAWLRTDRTLYHTECCTRSQALRERRERYHRFALTLTAQHGQIRIGKIDLRELARLESSAGELNELHRRARANRVRAALHELQQEIARAAARSGTVLISVDSPYTPLCHSCGASMPVGPELMVRCRCGHLWDQDEVAARNILAAPAQRCCEIEGPREREQRRALGLSRQRERLARMAAARNARRAQQAPQARGPQQQEQ